jgi:hypothetical protein
MFVPRIIVFFYFVLYIYLLISSYREQMGDTTGLSNTEAKELCKPPDPETKVS